MNKVCMTSIVSRNPDIVYTQIDNEMIMLDPKDQLFYGVNSIGAELWSLLEKQPLSVTEICSHVEMHYEVLETHYVGDVLSFIESMVNQNMLLLTE